MVYKNKATPKQCFLYNEVLLWGIRKFTKAGGIPKDPMHLIAATALLRGLGCEMGLGSLGVALSPGPPSHSP